MEVWNTLLRVYIQGLHSLLGLLEAISKAGAAWGKLRGVTHGREEGTTGSSPEPARRLAVVFAEHEEHAVSDKAAADILRWCYLAEMQLVYMYDPAGHLKSRAAYLAHQLEQLERLGQLTAHSHRGNRGLNDEPLTSGTTGDALHRHTRLQVGWHLKPVSATPEASQLPTIPACTCGMAAPAMHDGDAYAEVSLAAAPAKAPDSMGNTCDSTGNACDSTAAAIQGSTAAATPAAPAAAAAGVAATSPPAAATLAAAAAAAAGVAAASAAGVAAAVEQLTAGTRQEGAIQGATTNPAAAPAPAAPPAAAAALVVSSTPAAAVVASSPATNVMRVVLLSAPDAYSPVLEVVRGTGTCAVHRNLGQIKTPERSHTAAGEELLSRLAQVAGPEAAEEPQLILVYGTGPLTLAGFPPWQARSAEILAMGHVMGATQQRFEAALHRFCSTKQRWGK